MSASGSMSSESGCSVLPVVVGPVVGMAVLVEAVTIVIAVGCCIYLRRSRHAHRKRQFMGQASSKSHSQDYENTDNDEGSKTIRVVHNSLYQSMKSDDGNMSPVKVEYSRSQAHAFDFPNETNDGGISEARIVEELDLKKSRTRTQSSHAYEPINIKHSHDSVDDQPAVTVAETT